MDLDPQMTQLGIQLADAAVRNTVGGILDRIRLAKGRKRDQETINTLEEIVNELLEDKNELVQIARAYEQNLVAQEISEGELQYITDHLVPKIEQLAENVSEPRGEEDARQARAVVEILTPLLSIEMIKILQLIGFNFKRAIGEPLTTLAARAILAKASPEGTGAQELQALSLRREIAYIELARDEGAFVRLRQLIGGAANDGR